MDLTFDVQDLEIDDIVVMSVRDSVGLPESAASCCGGGDSANDIPISGSCCSIA